jgi:hypothetical protein
MVRTNQTDALVSLGGKLFLELNDRFIMGAEFWCVNVAN